MNTVKLPLGIARIQCDDILKSSMMARKNNVQLYINSFSYLKKVINKNIKHNILIPKNEDIDFSFLCLILRPSQHTKHTEPFFADPVYNPLPNNYKTNLEINEVGQIMNLFEPINHKASNISWRCNVDVCNLNYNYVIHRALKIINDILSSKIKVFKNKISYIDTCISETCNSLKLGHNLACHYNYTCTSNLLFLKRLGTHFPSIRSITIILYKMPRAQNLV